VKRRKEKPSPIFSTDKPMTLNLQPRPFAPVESEESAPVKVQNASRGAQYHQSENLLQRLINMPITESRSPIDAVQKKKRKHFPKIRAQREMASRQIQTNLQTKSLTQIDENWNSGEATTDLESSIQSARGSGQSLDPNLQAKMGQAMGADFSDVKIHTDSLSDQLNKSIQAKAFTTGQDLFFGQGEYEPNSRGGQELIAHELTHVVQQNAGAVQRSGSQESVGKSRSGANSKGNSVGGSQLVIQGTIQRKRGSAFDKNWNNKIKRDEFRDVVKQLVERRYPHLVSILPDGEKLEQMIEAAVVNHIKNNFQVKKDEAICLVDPIVSMLDVYRIQEESKINFSKDLQLEAKELSAHDWQKRKEIRENAERMEEIKSKNPVVYEKLELLLYGVDQKNQLEVIKGILDQKDPPSFALAIQKIEDTAALNAASKNWEIQKRVETLKHDEVFEVVIMKLYGEGRSGDWKAQTKKVKDLKKDRNFKRTREWKRGRSMWIYDKTKPEVTNKNSGNNRAGANPKLPQMLYGLTDAEAKAILVFTQSDYKTMNPAVHGGGWWNSRVNDKNEGDLLNADTQNEVLAETKDFRSLIRSGAKKLPVMQIKAYRGERVRNDLLKTKYGSTHFEPKTFQSNTTITTGADASDEGGCNSVLLKLNLIRGYDIRSLSNSPGEDEILTLDDASFKIDKITPPIIENSPVQQYIIEATQER
jgi:hypothetical protein